MNVLRRLNNFLLPQDLAKRGRLPEALAQLEAAPGRSWAIFALEGVLAPVCPAVSSRLQRHLTQELSPTFTPLLLTTSRGKLGVLHQHLELRHTSPGAAVPGEGPSLLHGAYLLPAPGLEAKPNITTWNETRK